jgi:hypothetical protein
VRGHVRTIGVAIEARDADGQYQNLAAPEVEVQASGQPAAVLTTRQVAPGRYETTIVADAGRPVVVRLTGSDPAGPGITARTVLPDAAAEYRFGAPDEVRLQAIASATGGVWRPTGTDITAASSATRTRRSPLWPVLLTMALLLWFVDLALRRVRIFEPPIPE